MLSPCFGVWCMRGRAFCVKDEIWCVKGGVQCLRDGVKFVRGRVQCLRGGAPEGLKSTCRWGWGPLALFWGTQLFLKP